jgi:DNA-directed RNA polymerase specialized sigma24 family protein
MQVSDTSAYGSPAGQSDAALISGVRAGDHVAYGLLCERHVAAARALARHLVDGARSAGDADAGAEANAGAVEDAVAETFTRILGALRRGGGPQAGFRPYLLVSLRRTVGERARGERRRPPAAYGPFDAPGDRDGYAAKEANGAGDGCAPNGHHPNGSEPKGHGPSGYDPRDGCAAYDTYAAAEPYVDPAPATNMIARAFLSLPERWQAVLWHTEIEGGRPGVVAPLLGLTPNGVAGLAYAAREGLRQAYLQLYLAESARRSCRPALDKLPAYIRAGLAGRDSARVERHLDGCRDCATIYMELADVGPVLRAIVGPLLLGDAAAGYFAEITGGGRPRTAVGPLGTGGGLRRVWRQRPRWQRRVLGAGTATTRQ